jgi:putative endonuclease
MPGYYIYILKSLHDSSCYIGFSTNVLRRLEEHNQGLSQYTRTKTPWVVVYVEEHATKTEALKREKFLKAQRNREFYDRLISGKVQEPRQYKSSRYYYQLRHSYNVRRSCL